ncbi:hypothetical protein BT96DRAFT_937418 [Gymnopus androsaceus JB14]|uniref:Myb/SANT-like domain-containing protein n=1 Tax=Gymnopus androsaceus JB14 TaxID=1447944 RepID=A0A6A4HUI6_9AGAR|nr:hypothetical protein BT96DRAFT_937418 [Gymnopus androsaceus JB14]
MSRNTAQAAESADSTVHNDKENNSPHPLALSPKKLPKKPKKPAKSKTISQKLYSVKATTKMHHFSAEDGKVMVETLLEQKEEGFATDNGSWKDAAFTAVVKALEGSELDGDGTLWISVYCVQASNEQWDNYLKYQDATFLLYEDLAELLNSALAMGKSAFHAGSKNQTSNASLDLDLGRDPIDLSNGDDDESSGNEEIFSQILVTPGPSKHKLLAHDLSVLNKYTHHERTGHTSTSGAIFEMSCTISNVAASLASPQEGESEQSCLGKAV